MLLFSTEVAVIVIISLLGFISLIYFLPLLSKVEIEVISLDVNSKPWFSPSISTSISNFSGLFKTKPVLLSSQTALFVPLFQDALNS